MSTRIHPAFRKRLEAIQIERGDSALSHTLNALLHEAVNRHEEQRRAA